MFLCRRNVGRDYSVLPGHILGALLRLPVLCTDGDLVGLSAIFDVHAYRVGSALPSYVANIGGAFLDVHVIYHHNRLRVGDPVLIRPV